MKRRIFLSTATRAATQISLAAATFGSLGACAETRSGVTRTRSDAEGPFYPVVPIPLDNNLLLTADFVGDELLFKGRVLDSTGNPVTDTVVEIWQCDGNSVYRHPKASTGSGADPAFRGYGATLVDEGKYSFTTIVPVPYPGRPPHIHVKLKREDKTLLTTQVYLHGFDGPDERKISTDKVANTFEANFDFMV